MKLEFFSQDFRKIFKYQIAWKSFLRQPSCSMRTDRQTWRSYNSRFSQSLKPQIQNATKDSHILIRNIPVQNSPAHSLQTLFRILHKLINKISSEIRFSFLPFRYPLITPQFDPMYFELLTALLNKPQVNEQTTSHFACWSKHWILTK